MTPEEQLLKETEDIVNGAAGEMSKLQTQEHQRMMPHFRQYADNMLKEQGRDTGGVHVFVIRNADEHDPEAHNPLNLDDGTTGHMSPMHTFDDIDQAVDHMKAMPAAVLFNEYRKSVNNQCAVYVVSGDIGILYCQTKLTVQKQLPNGDSLMETASIAVDHPDNFFDKLGLSVNHKMLTTAVLALYELGKVAEHNTPETYAVMVKRLMEQMESDDE